MAVPIAGIRRPALDPSPLSAPFWAAAARGELAIQACTGCSKMHHPPVPVCPDCHGTAFDFAVVAGTGAIYECSVMRQARVVGFEAMVPYACVVVELDEQPGLLVVGNLLGAPVEAARVGSAVRVHFEPYGQGDLQLPQFVLVAGAKAR